MNFEIFRERKRRKDCCNCCGEALDTYNIGGTLTAIQKLKHLISLFFGFSSVVKVLVSRFRWSSTAVPTNSVIMVKVVVDPNMDMELSARRILWGKGSNAGQVNMFLYFRH
jgi:hypothetical protein